VSARPATARSRAGLPHRRPADGEIAGVCAGLGERFGLDPVLFRIAFVAGAAAGGLGIGVYAVAWALMPVAPGQDGAPRRDVRELLGLALLVTAGLGLLRTAGLWLSDAVAWPVVLAATGLALVYGRGRTGAPRAVLGAILVVGAGFAFLSATDRVELTGNALIGMAVLLVAVVVLVGPYLSRLAGSLALERAERIRSQERAEVAAHLHDSVLQTLALIQRRSDEPREVAALARRQERELRGWLSGRPAPPDGAGLAAALERAAAEVEDLHGVQIEVVAVGDRPLDDRHAALVGAAREAMTNAARFAPDEPIQVYLEATENGVEVFVRDRGPGFDPGAIPPDRRGVRESILGRMERHGGRAAVNAAPGAGTEVVLGLDVREARA